MTSAYSSRTLSVFAPSSTSPEPGNQVISEQRAAARAVDQDVSRLQHRHRVLRRHDGHGALHPIRPARMDQIAEGMLDRVERAETPAPSSAGVH